MSDDPRPSVREIIKVLRGAGLQPPAGTIETALQAFSENPRIPQYTALVAVLDDFLACTDEIRSAIFAALVDLEDWQGGEVDRVVDRLEDEERNRDGME